MGRTSKLIGGTFALVGSAWVAAQQYDKRAIEADPARIRLDNPIEGRRVSVTSADGTALNVEVFGPEDAPTIILLHGWTCALSFWTCQIQELSYDHRVVAMDLRGHGDSGHAPENDYSIEAFADDFGAVLEACVPEGEKAVVVGHSMGAMSIIAWAGVNDGKVGERISAAAVINTGMGDLVSETLVVAAPPALDVLKRLAGQAILSVRAPIPTYSAPISNRVIRYVTMGPDASPAQVAFCERLITACDPHVRGACGGTLSELDLLESVAALDIPTVVIAGEKDRLTPLVHAEELAARLPNLAALVEIERSGHMSPVEFPDRVNEVLRKLVESESGTEALASL